MKTTFKNFHTLTEGVNDKSLFKALFIIGIAASGKTTVSTPLKFFAKHIDIDLPFEHYAEKYNIDIGRNGSKEDFRVAINFSKSVIISQLENYVDGMLPLIVNAVGDDIEHTTTRIKILRDLGYDVGMIYVNTDVEDSIKRALKRRYGRDKDRHRFIAPEHIFDSYHKLVANAKRYQDKLFDATESKELLDMFVQIKNDGVINSTIISDVQKKAQTFFDSPIKNEIGKQMLSKIKLDKMKTQSDILGKGQIIEKLANWFKTRVTK